LDLRQPVDISPAAIFPGIYEMFITVVDDVGNVNDTKFTNIINVFDSSIKPQDGFDPLVLGIIIAAVAIGIAIPIVIVVFKKKNQPVATESDLEMTSGPSKQKRRGKIYEGASAIGKKSGQEAELLQQRRETSVKTTSSSSNSDSTKPTIVPKVSSPKKTTTSLKSDIPESEKDIDNLLENVSKAPSSIKIKQAEASVDLRRKIDFLLSKLMGLDQNLALINVLLDQTQSIQAPSKNCPTCGRRIPTSWFSCPFCATDEQGEYVKEKMNQVHPIGQTMMCPVCKKVLQAEWSRCPYCLIRDRGQ
jgi:hypothetical protein